MMAIDGDDGDDDDDDDDDKLIIFPPKADKNFMKMRFSLQMISMISSNTKIYNEGSFFTSQFAYWLAVESSRTS